MVAFFGMIVNFFGWIAAFFARFTLFSSSSSIVQNFRFAIRVTLLTAFKISFVFFITLLFTFIYFALQSLVTIYNLISDIIEMMQNTGTYATAGGAMANDLMNGFFFFLNATGIADGISAAFPIVASAITFILLKNAYKTTLYFYEKIIWVYVEGVKLLTAA